MRNRTISMVFVVGLLAGIAPDAWADPVLLGTLNATTNVAAGQYGGPADQHFVLAYLSSGAIPPDVGGSYSGIPYQDSSYFPYSYCIGCDVTLPVGWTGSTDFNSGSAYHDFIALLTNGVNDGALWQMSVFTTAQGKIAGAFGNWKDESDWFTPGSQLDLWQVDFIRLNVLRNDVVLDIDHDRAAVDYDARWEFWGTDRAELQPVPEPAAILLFGSGMVGFSILSWRRQTHRARDGR